MEEKNRASRHYAHFDEKISLGRAWNYISNPENVKKHGFYPFIHYEKKFNKYKKENDAGFIKEKTRDLCYSAHIDRYIYSYYSYLLNQEYNKYLQLHDMNMSVVAYRDNLKKNNIHFAKIAFDYIRESQECYVIIGDFSHFFDSLDHKYLKEQICTVLGSERLPDDYYAVFKNITQYSIWELTDLLKLNGLQDTEHDIHTLNNRPKVLDKTEFKKYKREYVKKHLEDFGIPQGSAISAVLANVYMIKADEEIVRYVSGYNGLYMRYSDDFIIILPHLSESEFNVALRMIVKMIKTVPRLLLQEEKTQLFKYKEGKLQSCNALFLNKIKNGKNEIDYLGFTFNGKEITIRDKTVSKYYYRLYKKIKTIENAKGYSRLGKRISCKNLYEKYSVKGSHLKGKDGKVKGNFITYVQRAQKIFDNEESIDRKTKRHMLKIRRRLNKVFKK